jgi:hypothetical protein
MEKHTPPNRASLLKERQIFCTECGAFLENFCFSSGADDLAAIKKSLAQCRKEGKLADKFCAKLFIGDSEELGSLWSDEDFK